MIFSSIRPYTLFLFFFFNDTATTEIYTLSLHDALPIYVEHVVHGDDAQHVAAIIGHGQHRTVVFLERLQDGVTVVRSPHRDQLGIVDRHDVRLGGREHQIRETDILHQLTTGIDDVDPIEGFLPFAGLPDLVERRGRGHVRVDRSEERRVGKEWRSRWSPYH